nr:potassium channel family protein [uncultured Fluviicola sp.]
MRKLRDFFDRRKYEVLLVALLQHLFVGIFISDHANYRDVIWPINMFLLGLACTGIFMGKNKWKGWIKNVLFIIVVLLPIGISFVEDVKFYFEILNVIYVLFFCFIFYEVVQFLIKPSYIDKDVISAAACGYFLLIEISVFLLQFMIYSNPYSFHGIDMQDNASVYMDLVYFSSVSMTSIGFGDIVPTAHNTKLVASILGISGHFYTVVLVGIIISKFTSRK